MLVFFYFTDASSFLNVCFREGVETKIQKEKMKNKKRVKREMMF